MSEEVKRWRWYVATPTFEFCANGMAHGVPKYRLKEQIQAALENLNNSDKTPILDQFEYEHIRSEARKLLHARASITQGERFNRSIAVYENIVADESATLTERMAAQRRLDDIYGVGAKFNGGVPEDVADNIKAAVKKMNE